MNENPSMLHFHYPGHPKYFLGLVVRFGFGFTLYLDFPLQKRQREDHRPAEG